MKVLMFGWEFPPHISGGLGTACYGLTKGLSRFSELEVLFVVPKVFGDEDKRSLKELIGAEDVFISERVVNYAGFLKKIHLVEVGSQIVPYVGPEEYERLTHQNKLENKTYIYTNYTGRIQFSGGYGQSLFQEIANYAVIASIIGVDYHFDVIHAHDWLTFPAGIAVKEVSGKPLIIHVHATDFDRSGGNINPGVFEIEKRGMEAADMIIAVSNLTRNTIINNYGIDPHKVVTIYNAVEPLDRREEIKIKKGVDEKIVTFLGRVTLQKGPEYFIEAAKKVLKKYKKVRFVMAGSGDMLNRMIDRVAQLRIADRFHFTGFLQGDDVNTMFALSDVYVMPSVSEPFGISPLEAMQSNVPVIISHQSGVSEVLQYAIKVDFWDIDAMADAIYGILNYPGITKIVENYGREEVNNLKWENSANAVMDLYRNITGREL